MSARSIAYTSLVPASRRVSDDRTAGTPILDGLSSISRWIPSEGLALYISVAAFAALGPALVWVALIASLLLSAGVVALKASQMRKDNSVPAAEKPSTGRLWGSILVILLLQVAYISALQGNPVTGGTPNGVVVGGVIVIILAAFMNKFAEWLHIIRP